MISLFKSNIYRVSIDGMRCMNCAKHVSDAIKSIDGVKKVNVELENKLAIVSANPKDENTLKVNIKKAVEELGFAVVSID